MLFCNRKIIFDHFCYRYFSACMLQNATFVFINTKSCSKIWLCLRNRGTETSEERDVTALRCSEPLRYKDGGPSKVSPDCAGWDRLGMVQKELRELGLWKFAGAIMYIMHEVFGMPASRLIVPPNEKYGKFVLNEVLEAGNFGKHDARNRFGRSKLGHNLQRVYRDIRLVRYFPAEALSEPIFRTWHFFWRLRWDFTYRLR